MSEAEIYERINAIESKVDETNGYLRGVVESNEKLIRLMTRALYILAAIAFVSIFAVIYGAIGADGLHSVRSALPERYVAMPPHSDLDKWLYRKA